MGVWKDDVESWISFPTLAPTSSVCIWQKVVGMFRNNVAEETDDDVVCPYAWAKPINELNCEFIFPKELDEPPYNHRHFLPEAGMDGVNHIANRAHYTEGVAAAVGGVSGEPYLELNTPEYAGKITDELVVEKLLAQAGIRLAGVLNWLFADLEDEGGLHVRAV